MAPQSRTTPVLITRPEPQASRFAEAVRQRFGRRVEPILSPLMEARFTGAAIPMEKFGAVIFTSETGVLSARQSRHQGADLPRTAFCVGDRTAEVAAECGFDPVSANGDAQDLLALLLGNRIFAPFLHLRGKESRGEIVGQLQGHDLAATELITYEQIPRDLSPDALKVLETDSPVLVPLFSPKTAHQWSEAIRLRPIRAELIHFALSPAVAAELSAGSVHIADRPSQANLLDVMSQHLIGA